MIMRSLLLILLLPHWSTLFPYTTLFRSKTVSACGGTLRFVYLPASAPRWHVARAAEAAVTAEVRVRTLADRGLGGPRSEEHTSELQSHHDLVCRLLLEKKKVIAQ